jgi:hypothetical protein
VHFSISEERTSIALFVRDEKECSKFFGENVAGVYSDSDASAPAGTPVARAAAASVLGATPLLLVALLALLALF